MEVEAVQDQMGVMADFPLVFRVLVVWAVQAHDFTTAEPQPD